MLRNSGETNIENSAKAVEAEQVTSQPVADDAVSVIVHDSAALVAASQSVEDLKPAEAVQAAPAVKRKIPELVLASNQKLKDELNTKDADIKAEVASGRNESELRHNLAHELGLLIVNDLQLTVERKRELFHVAEKHPVFGHRSQAKVKSILSGMVTYFKPSTTPLPTTSQAILLTYEDGLRLPAAKEAPKPKV